MTNELKPCPFCGDPMKHVHGTVSHVTQGKCPIGAYGWGGENAVELWNRRAPLSTLAGDAGEARATLLRIHEAILLSDMRFVHPPHPDTWSVWADAVLDAAILLDKADRAAIAALDAETEGWRTIDSAPKDGTRAWAPLAPFALAPPESKS